MTLRVCRVARIRFGQVQALNALLATGSASWLVYLAYVLLFPLTVYGYADRPYDMEQIAHHQRWMGVVWIVGLVVIYVLFGLAVWVAGHVAAEADTSDRPPGRSAATSHSISPGSYLNRSLWQVVLLLSLLFSVTLIWLYPVTATDLFQYVMRARVGVIYGANPMSVAPGHFPGDPLLPFVGEWKNIVSPYGPAWELLAQAVARLGFTGAVSGALAYKGLAWLAYWVCVAALVWGTRSRSPASCLQALVFFAWNPMVLLQGIGNGHNDLVMLAWLLLALVIWQRQPGTNWVVSWLLAVACITLAVLTKAAAALMALLLWVVIVRDQPGWGRRVLVTLGTAGVAIVLSLLAYLAFWPPWQSIAGVLDEMSNRYTYTIAATLRLGLSELIPHQVAWETPRLSGQLLAMTILGWCAVQLWRRRLTLPAAGFLAYFAYLMGGASYRIWYPLWLVPLAALCLTTGIRWRSLLLSFTSEFSIVVFYYVWRWLWPQASWLQVHLLTVPWQFGLPLLVPIGLRQRLRCRVMKEDEGLL